MNMPPGNNIFISKLSSHTSLGESAQADPKHSSIIFYISR
jgi:hypothetical protein